MDRRHCGILECGTGVSIVRSGECLGGMAVRYRSVHCAEWRVAWCYGSAVQGCPLCGVESGLNL